MSKPSTEIGLRVLAQLPEMNRREWLKGAGAAAGLVLAVRFSGVALAAEEEKKYGADGMPHGTVDRGRSGVRELMRRSNPR